MYRDIDKKYGAPKKEISCPSCGQRYGHHNTKVDLRTEECSSCAKEWYGKDELDLVSATEFIEEYIGHKPL